MKLKQLEIRNFRSISHLTIRPDRITTFVGKNSCGKSNILRALHFFFTFAKTGIPDDLCKFADENGTWVQCTFVELTEVERENLDKYVRADGSICIRRTLRLDGDKCVSELNGFLQRPREDWLQEEYPEYANMERWAELGINVNEYAQLGARGKLTQGGFKTFREAYIARNSAALEFSEGLSPTEFKGRQSTAANALPHFIFVPAVGEIVSVIYGKQSSLLNEMVAAVIDAAKNEDTYREAQASLVLAQGFVNPSELRLTRLALIEQDLANRLTAWPGTRVTIRTRVEDLAKILVNGLLLSVDDGHETDLAEKGDGIQRQILFRVFQLYADYRAQRGVFAPAAGEVVPDRGPSIIAFEEPELFLHPQAQEQFYDDLVTVSVRDQVLLATHSSFLIRLDHADGLHIVRRAGQRAPTKFTTADPQWIDAGDRQRLKEIALCSGDISKVFFADRVVVTEGQEDVIYIVGTATDHARCLNRQVTVVQTGGKERITSLQKVLNAFGIPYIVACDRDPGNQHSEAASARIEALIGEANARHGAIASVEHFDPNLPHVCRGAPEPAGEKPFNALLFINQAAPTEPFVQRVRTMYALGNV